MARRSGVDWNGDEIRRRVQAASGAGINQVLADAVAQAKGNHAGWENQTGNAEGSVRVTQVAALEGARLVGRWGSLSVVYARRLEYEHGPWLRAAADTTYPTLTEAIRKRLHG